MTFRPLVTVDWLAEHHAEPDLRVFDCSVDIVRPASGPCSRSTPTRRANAGAEAAAAALEGESQLVNAVGEE